MPAQPRPEPSSPCANATAPRCSRTLSGNREGLTRRESTAPRRWSSSVSLALLDAQVDGDAADRVPVLLPLRVLSWCRSRSSGWRRRARGSTRRAGPSWRERRARAVAAVALAGLPLVVLGCYAWLGPAPNLSFGKVDGAAAYGYLTLLALGLVALNLCGGMALTLLFTIRRNEIGAALRGADLAGAALGCAASVGLMMRRGADPRFLAAGVAALAAAAVLGRRERRGRPRVRRSGAALVARRVSCSARCFPAAFDPYVALPQVRAAHPALGVEPPGAAPYAARAGSLRDRRRRLDRRARGHRDRSPRPSTRSMKQDARRRGARRRRRAPAAGRAAAQDAASVLADRHQPDDPALGRRTTTAPRTSGIFSDPRVTVERRRGAPPAALRRRASSTSW